MSGDSLMMNQIKNGFTLIELMIIVMVIVILAAIAFPVYDAQVRKSDIAQAEAELARLTTELESYKTRNFSYRGFTPIAVVIPRGATGASVKYTITILDGSDTTKHLNDSGALGRGWVMTAIVNSTNTRLANKAESYLRNSQGINCKNVTASLISASHSTCV